MTRPSGPGSLLSSPIAAGVLVVCLALLGSGKRMRAVPAAEALAARPERAVASPSEMREPGRGRDAEQPLEITVKGWRDIAMRLWMRLGRDNLTLVAAGVAFYALLAVFPAFVAFISVYGLVADAHSVERIAAEMSAFVPSEASKLLTDALKNLVGKANSKLNMALLISVLVALWSARAGMASLMTGLNIAYEELEKRSFLRQQVVAMALTIGAIAFAAVAGAALAGVPAAIAFLPLSATTQTMLAVARWPVLTLFVMIAVAILYRVAPSRREPKWRWVSWGAVIATLSWVAGSAVFSIYVSKFSSYDATYGSLGAVVVLLLWFWLNALIVLFGAVVNAEMEHQTARNSTIGPDKPLGGRGARMADTIGAAAS